MSSDALFGAAHVVLAVYAVLLLMLLAGVFLFGMLYTFREDLHAIVLHAIDSIIASILAGRKLKVAIADLVSAILKKPMVQSSIKQAVLGVLHDEEARSEITLVVSSVLANRRARDDIANVVHDVLSNGELEALIGKTVAAALNDQAVAEGILGAIKGTSLNALSEAGTMVDQNMPTVAAFARRRLGSGNSTETRVTTLEG